jgi:Chaperone of endosialidase
MADSKITALTNLTAADPVNDMLPIVDVSDTIMAASGTTKRISVNNILSSSPTASGALTVTGLVTAGSATITGAATVGTTLGVTGVSTFAAGTALLPALTTTGDVNTGIYYPAADTFAVTTGGTERYRVDSSGNVGVGVTPSAWHPDYKALQIKGSSLSNNGGSADLWLSSNVFVDSSIQTTYITNAAATRYRQTAGTHIWEYAGASTGAITFTQAMALDASGNLLVKKTALGSTVGFAAAATGSVESTMASAISAQSTLNVYSTVAAAFRFYVDMSGTVNATNSVISAISDSRLKENVQDIDVGLAAILSLKPRKFDWKAGKGKDIKGDRGFIAQEFETVFPNLVDEWKDPAPEGEAPYKSVRQDLIPVLVKAIQELTARVQTLESR